MATCHSSELLRNSHDDVMYGSRPNEYELTRSARVFDLNQIQTPKIHQVFQPAHDIKSSPGRLHSKYTRRSHCLHVLLGALRSHTTISQYLSRTTPSLSNNTRPCTQGPHCLMHYKSQTTACNNVNPSFRYRTRHRI